MKEQWGTSPKVEQWRGITATIAMASSLTKETGGVSTVGSNRIYSNGRSRKDECSDGTP